MAEHDMKDQVRSREEMVTERQAERPHDQAGQVEFPADWLEEFEAAARRPLATRLRYAFIRTYKPVLDDAPYRAFDTMEDYRRWCEEMFDDELTALDVERAILTGHIEKRFTRDPRGTRYEIVGRALDGRPIGVVCRLLSTGWLRIITVYALESEDL
jgi:hypothetical protein